MKITSLIDELVSSVVEFIYAAVAIFFLSVSLCIPLRASLRMHLFRLLRRSMKPETYAVFWAGIAIVTDQYLIPDFAVRGGGATHGNATFFLLVTQCVICLIVLKVVGSATAYLLSYRNPIGQRIIRASVLVLLSNGFVVLAGRGFVSILFEAQASALDKYPEGLLLVLACVIPLTSVLHKYIFRAADRRLKSINSRPIRRGALALSVRNFSRIFLRFAEMPIVRPLLYRTLGLYFAVLILSAAGAGYIYSREIGYNSTYRKLVDVSSRLNNSNTRCAFDQSGIRVKTYLTWYGKGKGLVDTRYFVVEVGSAVVGKGAEENEVLLSVGEPTPVTFTATDVISQEEQDDYDELRGVDKRYTELRKETGQAPFACTIALLHSADGLSLSETETKEIFSKQVRELFRKIWGGK